jgi:hypothetical protein
MKERRNEGRKEGRKEFSRNADFISLCAILSDPHLWSVLEARSDLRGRHSCRNYTVTKKQSKKVGMKAVADAVKCMRT